MDPELCFSLLSNPVIPTPLSPQGQILSLQAGSWRHLLLRNQLQMKTHHGKKGKKKEKNPTKQQNPRVLRLQFKMGMGSPRCADAETSPLIIIP